MIVYSSFVHDTKYFFITFEKEKNNSYEIISPTIGNIFLTAKTLLDQKYEVVLCEKVPGTFDGKKLKSTHYTIKKGEYLYLNISFRNQLKNFFPSEMIINDINSLITFFENKL